jgi:hypothetical protein
MLKGVTSAGPRYLFVVEDDGGGLISGSYRTIGDPVRGSITLGGFGSGMANSLTSHSGSGGRSGSSVSSESDGGNATVGVGGVAAKLG